MENPRFPHTLSVNRVKRGADGEIVYNSTGDVTYEQVTLKKVVCYDGAPQKDSLGQFVTTDVTSLEFGYRTDSTSIRQSGDTVVAEYKLALPMMVTELKPDDRITLTDYIRTFTTELVKQNTNNFGTNLWVNEIRN